MFEQLFQVFLSEWKSVGDVQTKTTLSPIDIHCVDKTHISLDDMRVNKWWKWKKLKSFNLHLDIILTTLKSLYI